MRFQAGRENLRTQVEMVISIRRHDVLDGSKLLDGLLGLVAEGGRSDNPDIAGGELDGSRATAHWEPSEKPGKWFREGQDLGSDLCRVSGATHGEFRPGTDGASKRKRYLANYNLVHLRGRGGVTRN